MITDDWTITDLETVAIDDAKDYVERPTAPSNYGIEAAARYIEKQWPKDIERAALDPDLARIVCLGTMTPDEWRCDTAQTEDDERAVLEAWAAAFGQKSLVTFNGAGYDLVVLSRRFLYLGLPLPTNLLPHNLDRYRGIHVDLYEVLGGKSEKKKAHALNWYAKRLHWHDVLARDPLPDGGASVAEVFRDGGLSAIADHCACDLELTKRLAKWAQVIR